VLGPARDRAAHRLDGKREVVDDADVHKRNSPVGS
jgi:hypothetical protein